MSDLSKEPMGWKAPCLGCKYSTIINDFAAGCTYFDVNGWPKMPFAYRNNLDQTRPSLLTNKSVLGPHKKDATQYTCDLKEPT